jgi:hemoglobin
MVVEYIRYSIAESPRQQALVDSYRQAAKILDIAPQCLAYELSRCQEDPSSIVLRIEWESIDAHLNGFRKGPHFRDFFAAIGDYVKEIAEMRHYQLTDVGRRK